MKKPVFFAVCFLFCLPLFAQQQMGPYMAYGAEASYFSNLNYRAYQSKNGYLWFGTLNGLVRFDGKRYRNYFSDYTDPDSPSDNTIFDIAEDKNNDLWFAGFYHGVTRYNQRTGRFKKYTALSKDNNPYYGIHDILSDRQGNLWFGTAGRGLAEYQFETDSFMLYYPEPSFPRDGSARGYNFITCIREDPANPSLLWLGSFHGLYSFNKSDHSFRYYASGLTSGGINDILIHTLEFDSKGILWIGTWGNGLNRFDVKTGRFSSLHKKTKVDIVYDLKAADDTSVYAACLNDGLYKLNTSTGNFSNITPPRNPADPTSQQPNIQKISYTPDAGILVGGNYYFYQLHPAYTRLKKTISFPGEIASKQDISINSFLWDAGRQCYWIATTLGNLIYRMDKDARIVEQVTRPATAGSKEIRWFDYLVKDARDRVWVLNSRDILLWDDQQQKFSPGNILIPLPDSTIKKITQLAASKDGNIWMKAAEQFLFWDIRKNSITRFNIVWDPAYSGEKKLNNCSLLAAPDGSCWLFSSSGIFHCIPYRNEVKHIFKTGPLKTDLSSTVIRSAAFNKYNDLWLTGGNGLQVFKWDRYQVRANHTIDKGLPSMNVNSVVADTSGRIWIASAAGLGLFDPSKKIWQLFNRMDGLENDYLDGNIFITSNNKLIIDQVNGFVLKDIDEMIPKGVAPALRITGIFVNKAELKDSLLPEFRDKLVLPYHQNNIDLEFAAMDWIYPFKTSYRYKIEGIAADSTWTPAAECKISLIGLQPGKYVVHVRALNSNANWSKELIFPITIMPPFWKTWWFILLSIAGTAVLLYGLYRYRINAFLEMQKVRNAISRDLHDEIGATLSSVNMLSAVALKREQGAGDIKPIIEQIKSSVQQAGESIDDIVWSVNPSNDSASDTFARIRKYSTELAELRAVNSIIDIDEPAANLKLPMEFRRDLYLICKEAVNNAMKYSECTEIKLGIYIKAGAIKLEIADNGKGFDINILKSSQRNGISNMKHRVNKNSGTFIIRSVKNEGTFIECLLYFK